MVAVGSGHIGRSFDRASAFTWSAPFQPAQDGRRQRRANVLAGRRDAIYVNRHVGKQHAETHQGLQRPGPWRQHGCTGRRADTTVPRNWNSSRHRGYEGISMSRRIVADNIKLKRAYDSADSTDGTRVLIDRLWPRGVRKADAAVDLWAKDIAPSTALRTWFRHDPARWQEFRRRYSEEIRRHRDRLDELRTLAQNGRITLVFAAHDEAHNDAVVLRAILLGRNIAR